MFLFLFSLSFLGPRAKLSRAPVSTPTRSCQLVFGDERHAACVIGDFFCLVTCHTTRIDSQPACDKGTSDQAQGGLEGWRSSTSRRSSSRRSSRRSSKRSKAAPVARPSLLNAGSSIIMRALNSPCDHWRRPGSATQHVTYLTCRSVLAHEYIDAEERSW
ncbi:hypothetical protein GGR56DRAFT_640157 [Xylariaceae sp. FL0804]|nr:hypothetical protein GGR56DRAFT_640157 [Xylariaceae sp. FL0804]